MLEQLKYKNHRNEVFEFGKDGIFVDTNDLHDYEWSVTQKNNRVSALEHAVRTKSLPIVIICETEEEGIAARNKLHEVVEKDVLAMQHGRIIIGDYYFRCFVTKSQKKDYLLTNRHMHVTLTLTSDFPFWVKETTIPFGSVENVPTDGFLDYSMDFPFDYMVDVHGTQLNNTGFVGSNFRLVVYGECNNPTINIAGHTYQVNCAVGSGEFLTIDSSTKKIYLTSKTGMVTNKFNDRSRDSYIFEKIPAGANVVSWNGDFSFDVVLLEERSEPKWT
jgi:phage-related protein